MYKRLTVLGIIVLVISGCSSSPEQTGQLDYGSLDELSYSLSFEIGEAEEYLPGEFSQIKLDSRGHILARDDTKITIEQFDPEGNHIATLASEGQGPGEIVQFSQLSGIEDDTLSVNFVQARKYALYAPNGEGIYTHVRDLNYENPHGGSSDVLGAQSASRIFLSTRQFGDLQQYGPDGPVNSDLHVDLVDRTHSVLVDSLHVMSFPNPIIDMSGGAFNVISGFPYPTEDRLRVFEDDSYVIARARSGEVEFYNADHELQRSINLNVAPRPVSDEDIEYALQNYDGETRERMMPRIPDIKPIFLNFWVTEDHIWMHTDNGPEGREMVVLTLEGEPVGRFYLGESQNIQTVAGNRIYVIDNESDMGSLIKVYEVEM